MSAINGTNINAPVVPNDTEDFYATHDAKYGKGGFRSVASLEERDAITFQRSEVGMWVEVREDSSNGNAKTLYRCTQASRSGNTWEKIEFGSGQAGSPVDAYTKSETDEKITEKVTEEIAKVVDQAPEEFDTLKEIGDWIKNKKGGAQAAELAENIAEITQRVETLESGAGGGASAQKTYDKFVVVGVYGQSNSVGYDESPLTMFDVPVEPNRVKQYSNELKPLTYMAESIQLMNRVNYNNQTAEIQARTQKDAFEDSERSSQAKTKGIHLPLANLICNAIPDDYGVIIVPGSVGGLGIASFMQNAGKPNGIAGWDSTVTTNIWTEFVRRLKGAMANEKNIFAGIVWCQGETDAANKVQGSTYKSNLTTLVNSINSELAGYAKRSTRGSITEKDWYTFEWPLHYKNADTTGILAAMREYFGDRYVRIPDDTAVNTTHMTSSSLPQAHFSNNTYRTVIAPRVFNAMQSNGAFLCNRYDKDTVTTEVDTSAIENRVQQLETKNATLQEYVNQLKGVIDTIAEKVGDVEVPEVPVAQPEWRAITTGEWTRGFGAGSNPENDVYACTGTGGCSGYYVPAEAKGVRFKIRSGDAVKSNVLWLLCSYNGELNQPAGLTMDFESNGTVVNWIKSAVNFNQFWGNNGASAQEIYNLFNKHDEEIVATFENDNSIKVVSGDTTKIFTPVSGHTLRFGFGELGNTFSDNNTDMYDVQILI